MSQLLDYVEKAYMSPYALYMKETGSTCRHLLCDGIKSGAVIQYYLQQQNLRVALLVLRFVLSL